MPVPAGPVDPQRFEAGLALLRSRYRVVVAADADRASGYLAGSDDERADELNRYLRDPDVRAIFIGRGGYGITRILDRLDAGALAADPRPIVGFSDATALIGWAVRAAKVRPIHGPVVTQLGDLPPSDAQWLFDLLEQPRPAGVVANVEPADASFSGPLVGGNLTLVAHLLATPYALPFAGAVAFFEDVGERPYRIDRYLTQLALAGALSDARGAVVGDFTGCDEPPGPRPVPHAFEVIGERFAAMGLPWIRGLPSGHGASNRAVPIGARCSVGGGVCEIIESAVQ